LGLSRRDDGVETGTWSAGGGGGGRPEKEHAEEPFRLMPSPAVGNETTNRRISWLPVPGPGEMAGKREGSDDSVPPGGEGGEGGKD